jgi:hypothetical protein
MIYIIYIIAFITIITDNISCELSYSRVRPIRARPKCTRQSRTPEAKDFSNLLLQTELGLARPELSADVKGRLHTEVGGWNVRRNRGHERDSVRCLNAGESDSSLPRIRCDVWVAREYNCGMSSIEMKSAVLTAHPSTPKDDVRSIEVRLRAEEPDVLVFQYSLVADMSHVRVPVSGAGGRADALWQHTCFEAFIAAGDAPDYHEFNFSPSLDWAIYRFSAYREGMSPAEIGRAPEISVHRGDDELELRSTVRLGHLANLRHVHHLRIALAAVIEDDNGRLSYWGLRHPPGKPDFHHPNGFALEVTRS